MRLLLDVDPGRFAQLLDALASNVETVALILDGGELPGR